MPTSVFVIDPGSRKSHKSAVWQCRLGSDTVSGSTQQVLLAGRRGRKRPYDAGLLGYPGNAPRIRLAPRSYHDWRIKALVSAMARSAAMAITVPCNPIFAPAVVRMHISGATHGCPHADARCYTRKKGQDAVPR